ncbi:PAS domain S-box protein [Pedobacter fastidiosus]|uniref:PAS domain S-box protein n=1 Tax=Pedobacter fastidiosus TaxID=2765361 RepID=A0ABR7KU03_9SPHI|nr:PAS domain S-box protein [Pedobacter fastidiosus]MBC6111305.1 PAS domain S-box protein [Pedobacter fastidiosus]
MPKPSNNAPFDLEYFFELSPDLLCVAGYDGYFKKINPAVSKTLGYSNEELLAAPINSFVHPADKERTGKSRDGLRKGEALLRFENRYLAKDGTAVWLSWTSIPIERDRVVFAIAKDITYRKQFEEYERISVILMRLNTEQIQNFKIRTHGVSEVTKSEDHNLQNSQVTSQPSESDQTWLNGFETIVRKNIGKHDLTLSFIGSEMAISERQLFRQINRILGITPNNLIRIIRLQMAWEAIATGKYRTIMEIANLAGYSSRAYFKKLFEQVYGIDVGELI